MTEQINEKLYPLTSTQREIWFDQILHPNLPLYNIGGYLRIDGPIDPALFEKALNQVIEDNDALRIRLFEGESLPMQTFAENIPLKLDYYDFAATENAHQAALAWMTQEFAKPFQLYDNPLFQFALFKITANCYYSFQKYHHLIVDGWAISLVVQRVAAAYNALASGQDAQQKSYAYQAFLHNDQAYLESEKFAKAKRYWLDKYREVPEPLLTRHYAAQPLDKTISSQRSILHLKRTFYNQVVDFSEKNKVSLFRVILGALYCYFSKTTGQKDLVIGLPILNRGTAFFKQTVGLFTNLIPARFHFGLDLSFVELMQAISIELRRDYRYQRFPISEINRGLHLIDQRPLFDLELSYMNGDYDTDFTGSLVEMISLSHHFQQKMLVIYVNEFNDRHDVRVDFDYHLGAFDENEIELVKARFEFLLAEIIRQPESSVRSLQIIPKAERQKMLACSKKGNKVRPKGRFVEFSKAEQSIPARFEQQVKQYPNRIAVKTQRDEWTYSQLNDKANQVAHALLEQCQADDNQIALLFEHDAPMLAGIMGVLKTGKTYVPLVPDFPHARLEYIVQDSQASMILTNTHNQNLAQTLSHNTLRLLNIEQLKTVQNEIDLTVSPETIAYLLYTSGSTGQPKGVIQNHRNVLHFIRTYTNNLHITADDKLTLLSYYSFDAAIMDIFGALLNGATLYPVDLKAENFDNFTSWLIQQGVTIYHSTPTVYRHWLSTLTEKEEFPKLRLMVLGGEPVYQNDVAQYKNIFSRDCLFVNGLGPTESTVSLQYFINKQTQITRHDVPVGYPLPETEILLLDESGQIAEIYGEIAIRSPYLALGYWQQPELTKAVFLPDPEGGNRRIYRSGDLGRLLPDGRLEFVGRKDFQVKLRGFRIELSEIEAILTQHENVTDAVVVLQNPENNPRLVAYVTLTTMIDEMSYVLRTWLKTRLPEYMLPASVMVLDKLPLTPNGKIDRKALPAPDLAIQADEQQAPQTETERLLCNLWSQVLGIEVTSRVSHFFEAGGHSLLATQLVSRIRFHFEIEMPLPVIFEQPLLIEQAKWLDKKQRGSELSPIMPRASDEPLVLSFAQQRLWFLAQLEGQSATYSMPFALHLSGQLNETALQQALITLVQRHESLRLCFPEQGGEARVLCSQAYDPLSITDLSELSETSLQRLVTEWIANHAQTPFDLSTGPLLRLRLLKLGDSEQILLFNIHHIISDGWSMSVLTRDLSQLYSTYCQNREVELSPLPIQYPDYAAWQRNWLAGAVLERQLTYWQNQLSGAPELLELPTDFPRPAVQQYQGHRLTLPVPTDLTAQLQQFSQQGHFTLFMTLLGAFNILLYRYSGQNDLCIGTPVANRNHRQLEELIGLFLSTVVLRTRIPAHTTFRQLLAQIRQTTLDAFAHIDVPFEMLVEKLQPQRSLSYHPLFQVMLNLVNTPETARLELPGIQIERLPTSSTIAKFDLNLAFLENADGLTGRFEYDTALFTEDTIRFLGECYLTLLQQLVAKPDAPLSELSVLSDIWKNRVAKLQHPNLVEPVDQQIDRHHPPFLAFPKCEQSIGARFEQQVKRYPNQIAVKTRHSVWTYQQLNDKANQVAHALLEQCQTNEERIALLFEHDALMLAGIMGVLKAGKTYVPLAPDLPRARLEYIVQDSQVTAILTNKQNLSLAQTLNNQTVRLINIDPLETKRNEIHLTVSPDTIAYLLYTSGSTGQPKGVIQNHRNVLHFIRTYTNNLHITADDKLTLLSFYSFDAAVVDIFTALLNGATVYPINLKEDNFATLSAWLSQQQVTIYHSTPTVYRHWLQRLSPEDTLEKIRLIVLSGEPIYQSDVDNYQQHFSSECLLVNGLGSTESTFSLQYLINKQTQITRRSVPVGYPLPDTEILLLDEAGSKTEIYGEIAIRSPYLALGYWQQPELTKTVFLPDPEGGNRRIYCSGDLGRLLPDGRLEFVGRSDFQVKLRGFRIELGEIEVTLSQHDKVKEAVVILHHIDSNPRLVAYVTVIRYPLSVNSEQMNNEVSEQTSLITELRDWLKARLPEYMLPASVLVLDKLPLTPNGKIDRKALPAPDLAFKAEPAPLTETEHLLCNLWSQVLGISVTSRQSHFFEVGGHSLLATQLVSRIRKRFEIEMPLPVIFEQPLLQEQAKWLDKKQRGLELPPIMPRAADEPLVLSFAQQRLWFLAQLEGQTATYNMPATLHLKGRLNETALQHAWTALIQRHDSLRLCFPVVDGKPTVRWCEVYNPLNITDLSNLSETSLQHQVTKWIANHAQTPFSLSTGPLLRLRLLKLGEQEQILLFNMHHIISDGWSMGILIRDWSQLYNAYAQNQKPHTSKLPIQYPDFAAWQRNWLEGSVLEQQLAYWLEKLSKAPELLELPTDYPRTKVMRYFGQHLQSTLDIDLTQGIKQLSQQHGVTVFMTLLAAFKVLLFRYSGQTDQVVGSPIANRTHHQIEDLIGFFVNTLVLRTQLKGQQTFLELLSEVRQTALEAYKNQDIPFEYLVEQLNPTRSLSYSPLFQVMFVLQNAPHQALELSGLKRSVLKPEKTTTKFDLTLSVKEQGEVFVCDWEYNTDLFCPETIALLSEHFQVLLAGILHNPEQLLSQLPLLTQAEQQQLMVWNQTETDYPLDKTIVDLFQEQVEKTPDNMAVIFEKQQLTYLELNAKANQLAHYLMNLGISVETLVGICVERSLEMVIGLLGILKAGGAYVPLAPDYPHQRLQFMLEDSKVPVLLSQSHLLSKLPVSTMKVVCLDNDWEAIAAASSENPVRLCSPLNLAYVIYTSGSTGRPKGVAMSYGGLYNLMSWQMESAELHSPACTLQFTSLNFDVSFQEIFSTWSTGGRLVLISEETRREPAALFHYLSQHQIERLYLPFVALDHLAKASDEQSEPLFLKDIITAGEQLKVTSALSDFFVKHSGCRLYNHYGPTESHVVTSYLLPKDVAGWTELPFIGRPIANTQIYILDANHNPTPLGIPGELCIAGRGLARGYLNRPELTTEKFIEIEIFGPRQRIYKTGDLARWLPDGNLEYLGRLDHQVKLRGFRIELGEIEVTLTRHEAVKEAVVVLHHQEDNPRLVAYVTLAMLIDEVSGVLRTWLKARLPEYMVPVSFTVLDKLPLTPNGKIDRKALRAPDAHEMGQHYQAPRDTLELKLAQIWENVLAVRPIGIADNFFELGGHSLLAVRLMAQIEQQFDKHLPLATLFQGATIEQLANQLRLQTDSQTWSSLVAIQPNGTKPPFFCVPGIGSNVLYFYELAHHLGQEQPFYALQAVGLDGKSAPFTSIEEMADHYLKELQTVQTQGPYLLGGHSFGGLVAFEMSLQLQKQGHEVAFLGIFDMMAPPFTAVGVEWDETGWLHKIAQFMERELGQKLEVNDDRLQSLDADAQLDYLNEQLKEAHFIPKESSVTQLRGLVNVFKANSQISYVPLEITKTPITLFKAKLARSDVFENEPTCGWHQLSESGVSVQIVPGDHFTMMKKPDVQVLAAQLQEALEQAEYKL